MTNFCRASLLLILLFIPFFGFSQNSKMETTDLVITKTHVHDQLEERIAALDAQLEANIFGLPEAKNEQMLAAFRKSFHADSLISKVKQEFQNNFKANYAGKTTKWLANETGKIITVAQGDFYSLQGKRKQIVARYEMEQNPPPASFTNTIDSLVSATSAVESTLDTYTVIFRSAIGAFVTLSNQQSLPAQQIESIISNYRSQTRPQLEQGIRQQLKVMYYKTSEEMLKEYLSFNNSEAGKWLNKTTTESIQAALNAAAEDFEQAVQATN